MPGTYSQVLLHIVFSTKHRKPWITAELADRLYPYIGGIIRAEKGALYDTYPTHRDFAWQEGCSVFSVSKSQEDAVRKYIANQAEHQKKADFNRNS